jgi:hypothetical protein
MAGMIRPTPVFEKIVPLRERWFPSHGNFEIGSIEECFCLIFCPVLNELKPVADCIFQPDPLMSL